MVEQSIKRRSDALEEESSDGSGGLRMLWKTFLTWDGSGRVVIITSCSSFVSRYIRIVRAKGPKYSMRGKGQRIGFGNSQIMEKSCITRAPNLDHLWLEIASSWEEAQWSKLMD